MTLSIEEFHSLLHNIGEQLNAEEEEIETE